jgi:NAD(P)-dependent dehydrogenase (short-subunit alcohol dehydrogenase family)
MIIVITGATGGIGRAAALDLAEAGHDVYAVCRPGKPPPAGCRGLAADLADLAQTRALLAQLPAHVDVLINNAGVPPTRRLVPVGGRALSATVVVNLLSPFLLAYGLLGRVGKVVNVSSAQHWTGRPITLETAGQPTVERYADTKFSLLCLSLALHKKGVPTVTVNPGYVDTGIWHPRAPYENIHAPLRKVLALRPEDTAQLLRSAVLYTGEKHVYLTPYRTPALFRHLRRCAPAWMLVHDVLGKLAFRSSGAEVSDSNPRCAAAADGVWRTLLALTAPHHSPTPRRQHPRSPSSAAAPSRSCGTTPS